MNCMTQREPGVWTCNRTGKVIALTTVLPIHCSCPEEQQNVPLGKRVYRWGVAVWEWAKAGFPRRTDEEVDRFLAICREPCDRYDEEKGRCKTCGCNVNRKRVALVNKIRMATEHCPAGKW